MPFVSFDDVLFYVRRYRYSFPIFWRSFLGMLSQSMERSFGMSICLILDLSDCLENDRTKL